MLSQPFAMGGPVLSAASPVRLESLCRMCGSTCSKPVLMFSSEGIQNELSLKFNQYLPVKITASDTLPLQLCYECTNMLIQWDAAVLVATATDKKLKALQWREQQSQQLSMEKNAAMSIPAQPTKRQSTSGESLCCSVCKKTGMDFRELVLHLKTHDMPSSDTEELNAAQNDSTISDSEQEINEELLEPIVCLETSENERRRSSKKRTNESLENDSKESQSPRRHRHKRKGTKDDTEGDSGDPVVTSSTSGKPIDNCESDVRKNSNQSTFKPKVRIISAESINQSLEERAKANQMARKEELKKSPVSLACPPQGALQPVKTLNLPSTSKWTRVVIPGNLVKTISSSDSSLSKPKFLKLADGRVIRLLGSLEKNGKPSKAVLCTSSPVTQQIPQTVLSQITSGPRKAPVSLISKKPDAPDALGSPLSFSGNVSPPVIPAATASKDNPDAMDMPTAPIRENVKVGMSRIITFNLQPGPKHVMTRYTCMFCGKRNLPHETLYEHAQTHSPKKDNTNPDKSLS